MKNLVIGNAPFTDKLQKLAFGAIGIGLLGSLGAAAMDMHRFWAGFIVAYAYCAGIGLTALFFAMLQFVANAGWSASWRRISEILAGFVPFAALGMLVILALIWVPMKNPVFDFEFKDFDLNNPALKFKLFYLSKGFFSLRLVLYAVIWTGMYSFFVGNSMKQDDANGNYAISDKLRSRSAPLILVYALTSTFAGFDILMSLDAHWFSTMFGVYYFAGNFVSTISLVTILTIALRRAGYMNKWINDDHIFTLGKMMFAFTVFWAYIAFFQYMLIWYANMPEETAWYLRRTQNGWEYFAIALILFHFIVPFVTLLQQHFKRNSNVLIGIALMQIVMHFIDLSWVVLPNVSANFQFGWQEISVYLLLVGIFLFVVNRGFRTKQYIAAGDPYIKESVEFVN